MRYFATIDDSEHEYRFERNGGSLFAHRGDERLRIDVARIGDSRAFSLLVDGRSYDCLVEREGARAVVQLGGERIEVRVEDERERAAHRIAGSRPAGPRAIEASMPGIVVDVLVAEGDAVEDGQTLVVLEAMKMQNPIQADGAGVVASVAVSKGKAVAAGAVLVELR